MLELILTFFIIGLGPALSCMGRHFSTRELLIFAPVLGYAITVIVGVYLTLLNIPAEQWAWDYTWIAIAISLLMCTISRVTWCQIWQNNQLLLLFYALVILLLTLPMISGGINFTVLRGNGTDAFNYMTMAGFLQHEPLSLLKFASFQELLDKHASYPLAKELLTERWATALIFAYYSILAKIPLYQADYSYSLVFFILSSGLFYLWLNTITKQRWLVFLLAITCVCGFWAQFILDIRAMSQMSALPVMLMFNYLFAKTEKMPISVALISALLLASIVLLYVELIPIMFVACGLYTIINLTYNKNIQALNVICGILIVSLVLLIPTIGFLQLFFKKQMHIAATNINNWHQAYFSWLYDYHIMGFWGLGPFTLNPIAVTIGNLFAALLSIPFIRCLLTFWRHNNKRYLVLSTCYAWSGISLFIFLFAKGQYWAAGKALSFVYPFFIVSLLAGIELFKSRKLRSLTTNLLLLWLISQLFLAIIRTPLAIMKRDFPHYIYGHGYYRQHDFSAKPFQNIACKGIIIDIKDGWLQEYFNFVFGWQYPIYNLHGVLDRSNHIIGTQKKQSFDCLLRKKSTQSKFPKQNKEFTLIRI